jgi:drug/metabolite transporter (DMT)-like permease
VARTVRHLRRHAWEAALVAVTIVWGSTFVMVKDGVARIPPYSFNALRFSLAAVVLGACCLPALRTLGPHGRRHGAILGVLLFAGYAFQTVGLQHTAASTAGFITGMFVVFTPVLSAAILRRRPGPAAVAGVALATVGLGLLSLRGSWYPGFGDLLILGCALAFAAHIVGLGAWSSRHATLPLTTVQLAVAALLHSATAAAIELPRAAYRWDGAVIGALLVTALLASAAGFWIQTGAQRVIPPTRTAIILTMEPVFAGLFGYALLHERLSARGWLGAAVILAGMLTAELGAAADPDLDERAEAPAPHPAAAR